jgi:hypothetical protein
MIMRHLVRICSDLLLRPTDVYQEDLDRCSPEDGRKYPSRRLDSGVGEEQSYGWLDEEARMADKTHDQRDSVESAKEALRLMRLAGRLSASAQILSDAANAIQLVAALALGAGGLQDAPQSESDDPTVNPFVNDQDIDFIKDLIKQQSESGSSFAGCHHAWDEALDAALETTAPGSAIRNKIMNAANERLVRCLRMPKVKIVVPEEPGE